MTSDFTGTLDYLRRLCSAREYCSKDIYDKALKRLESPSEAAGAVKALQDEGYQSDERYSAAFARDKAAISGWGSIKIACRLKAKGISPDVISAALKEIDEEKAGDKLRKSLEARYKLLKDDPQVKIKLLKFALSRGYSYEEVQNCLDSQRAE